MAIYDLTTFTEINDGSNLWTQTVARNATTGWVSKSNSMVLYKDMGVDVIEDYEYYLDVNMTNGVNYGLVGAWAVTNSAVSIGGMSSVPGQRIQLSYSGGVYFISLRDNTTFTNDYGSGFSLNTIYYLKVYRVGSTATCKIYPTSSDRLNDTNVIDTLSITCVTTKLRYLQAGMGAGTSGTGSFQGYFENFEAPIPPLDIQETITFSDEVVLSDVSQISQDGFSVSDDFESYVVGYSDISNKINVSALITKDINDKINTVKRVISDFLNIFSSTNGIVSDVDNDIRTLAETEDNIKNDIRFLADWQIPGDAGFESLGKTYVKVYIGGNEQTDVDVDSITITKNLNSPHIASFTLGRAYDDTKPTLEFSVEIKYHIWTLYKGYITSITPTDSPDTININCQDEYWNQNKTKKWFFVGHKPQNDNELYYSRISTAISSQYSWALNIGNFVPQVISSFGVKASDNLSTLITNAGNFGWYYHVNKSNGTVSRKLWTADDGAIINIDRQNLDENLNLYHVIRHKFTESVEGIVNRYRVQMGGKIRKRYNDTGGSQLYASYSPASVSEYASRDWDASYEGLSTPETGNAYGFNYPDPNNLDKYRPVFRRYKLPDLDPDVATWDNTHEPTIEITNPGFGEGWILNIPIEEELLGKKILHEGFGIDYENGIITFDEPIYYYKINSFGEATALRAPNIKLRLWKKYIYSYTGDSSENPEVDESFSDLVFLTAKYGDYVDTVWELLSLPGLSIQQGDVYINPEGETVVIPSWNDTAFASDFANWQLTKNGTKKITGNIDVTLDAFCFYDLDLSKRINIDNVTETAMNITSISINISSFITTISVANPNYFKRTVSLPSRGE